MVGVLKGIRGSPRSCVGVLRDPNQPPPSGQRETIVLKVVEVRTVHLDEAITNATLPKRKSTKRSIRTRYFMTLGSALLWRVHTLNSSENSLAFLIAWRDFCMEVEINSKILHRASLSLNKG